MERKGKKEKLLELFITRVEHWQNSRHRLSCQREKTGPVRVALACEAFQTNFIILTCFSNTTEFLYFP